MFLYRDFKKSDGTTRQNLYQNKQRKINSCLHILWPELSNTTVDDVMKFWCGDISFVITSTSDDWEKLAR
jgi:hypothetical protein